VLKKLKKDYIVELVDKDPGGGSFQAAMRGIINLPDREPYIATQPYFIHFVTTNTYDSLWVIINQGDQKRIIQFKERLSNTQFNKILPQWKNIGKKSKTEVAECIWKSLDVKEVNKDFYKHIKERFDAAIGIAKLQYPNAQEQDIKQFVVRLIGRYIFCWFLKEKEIIPSSLLSSATIRKYQHHYFQTYLSHLYFNTLNEEVQSRKAIETKSELDSLFLNIPYLNGGLFDKHPEDELFDKIDLNAWLINFVEVLESFDFTVDESSSQYQLVAIDPEMLGRIFENLLASQNQETEKLANQRKAFGAFYTPREIVDYMVNESLKAHLETHLLPTEEVDNSSLNEPLVTYKGTLFAQLEPQQTQINLNSASNFDKERKREKLKAKIEKLFAPDCLVNPFDKNESQLVRKALSEVKVLDPACGSGAFPMGMLLRLMELRQIVGHGHKNNYELKNEILSKNIFGVDIMPMAVEISRLRAWLSLVLEADYKPTDRKNNFGVSALPNLDFKFVCANSLIDSGYDTFLKNVEHNATLMRLDGEIQKLEQIRDTYFDPKGDKFKKVALQKQFIETKNYIKTEFKSLRKTWKLDDFLNKVDDWNPFDDSHPSTFFSPAWMFGIKDGFDVVIGNPPYVQMQKGKYSSNTFPYSEGKDKGKQNLYKVFVEASYNALKTRGTASMIVQSSLLCDLSSTHTRELLLTKTELKKVLEYPKSATNSEAQVFDSVLQGTCTYIFSKHEPSREHLVKISIHNDTSTISNPRFENLNQLSLLKLYPDTNYIPLVVEGDSLALNRISNNSVPFSEYTSSINQGDLNLTTSANEFSNTKSEVKLYRGRNIHKYSLLTNVEEYLNVTFKKEKVIENQKHTFIVLQEITGTTDKYRLHACLTDKNEKFLFGHTANKVLLKDESLNLSSMALLNSKLLDWFFRKTSTNNHVMGYEIKQLPFPIELKKKQQPIILLVEKIISLKKSNQDTTALEREIDVLVYKLYELTYDEVKIVDKDFWMSEAEYEKK
jgi:Alw26I/Eco31I/Esp3I family type II restriction m6 adenine DNA methyltransferase